MMQIEHGPWIRRHAKTVMSFVIGITFGASIVALAYFATASRVGSQALEYGIQATGHKDLDEDLLWFLGGGAVGAGAACWAWWRKAKSREFGLENEHVLNRITASPGLKIVGTRGSGRRDPGQ